MSSRLVTQLVLGLFECCRGRRASTTSVGVGVGADQVDFRDDNGAAPSREHDFCSL